MAGDCCQAGWALRCPLVCPPGMSFPGAASPSCAPRLSPLSAGEWLPGTNDTSLSKAGRKGQGLTRKQVLPCSLQGKGNARSGLGADLCVPGDSKQSCFCSGPARWPRRDRVRDYLSVEDTD